MKPANTPKTKSVKDRIGVAEAAKIMRIASSTLYGIVERGEIPFEQKAHGDPITFDRGEVESYVATNPLRVRGRPRVNPIEDRVRVFGRATDTEVARWQRAAKSENYSPWLRRLANSACDKAGV